MTGSLRRRFVPLFLLAFIVPAGIPAGAATIRVPGDRLTIQAGIDAAAAGDTVLVAPGTYGGPGNRDVDFFGKAATLLGQDGASATIIDCGGSPAHPHRAFLFIRGETGSSVVEGFTMRNGFGVRAGAISCVGSSPTIRSCVFSDNYTTALAGAIEYDQGGGEIIECQFERDRARTFGGAIACYRANLAIVDCEFRDCSASDGGAVHADDSSLTVTGCSFSLCQSGSIGGAMTALGRPGQFLWVFDCTFDFCIASFGGGVSVGGLSVEISGSIFSNCFGTDGGAIFLDRDGGLAASHCTFWNCSAQRGACLFVRSSPGSVENSIMAFSSQGAATDCVFGGSLDLACCDVFGNAGGDWVGCIAGQQGTNGNLAADPQFCAAPQGDFSLHASSPCAPGNTGSCGLIGARDVGCGATAVDATTWGRVKARFVR